MTGPAIAPGKPARSRHSARHGKHARSSDARLGRRPPLSIRSAEGRRWSADLSGPGPAGLVVHGIGGIGKSTLAMQIAARVSRLQSGRILSVLRGELSAGSFAAASADADFIICDDFDDNLSHEAGQWCVRDPELAAALTRWTGKLLIISGRPFTLTAAPAALAGVPVLVPPRPPSYPTGIAKLVFRQVGPLTRSGAGELTGALPAIRLLDDTDRDRIWRLTAGHPLAIEYLDSLLAAGERFPEVARRVEAMVLARTGEPLPRVEPTELPEATAEAIADAAGDQLFGELYDRLSAGARTLLVRTSVFRLPIPADAVAAKPGQLAECELAGLLASSGQVPALAVPRWTAGQLHRRLAEASLGSQVVAAHRQAAGYWRDRAADTRCAGLEAGYHQRQLSQAPPPDVLAGREPGSGRRRRVVRLGVAGAFAVVSAVLAVEAAQGTPGSHLASAETAAQTSARVPVSQAAAVRTQAAAWAASQVSGGAVIACDPAMCSVLTQHGVPTGDLLVVGPGTSDPLGSDVVVATAAVRSLFGSRLTTVYAPDVLASFGSGSTRIDIRVVASDGATAYASALTADQRAREVAGQQLIGDLRIGLTAAARAQLAAGAVDARLLMTLAMLGGSESMRIEGFSDDGPGASAGMPLRQVTLTASTASARKILAFYRAQRAPFLPDRADLAPGPAGQAVLTVQFAAPGPLGLLQPQSLSLVTRR
jgi:hypothetical protein